VIDSAPLTEVIDALPLAREVDDVLLVARLGKTNLRKLTELGEVLAQNDITPVGIALVGVERTSDSGYYYVRGQSEPLPGAPVGT
jgi:Mrp family chromosome partitioning ATPase